MKALTVCNPYAELIARGVKRVENRTWPCAYRGPLAIHAGKSRTWLDLDEDGTVDEQYGIAVAEMKFGYVVAVCELVACVPMAQVRAGALPECFSWLREHEHTEGPWCWVLDNVRRLDNPIEVRGAQGLWEWNEPTEVQQKEPTR